MFSDLFTKAIILICEELPGDCDLLQPVNKIKNGSLIRTIVHSNFIQYYRTQLFYYRLQAIVWTRKKSIYRREKEGGNSNHENKPKKNSRTWSWSIHKANKKRPGNYFLVESIIFFVLSVMDLVVSVAVALTLSVFTTVVESVVVVVDVPDPQAANELMANTVNNFFMLMSFNLIPNLGKGNPVGK